MFDAQKVAVPSWMAPPPQPVDSRTPTIAPSYSSYLDMDKDYSLSSRADSLQDIHLDPGLLPPEPLGSMVPASYEKSLIGKDEKQDPVAAAAAADNGEYPTGMKLSLIVLALCLAIFVMALDNSIIATAIPRITDEFHSLNDVGWYGSAYLLTTASLQLLCGRLYSYFSIKWIFLATISLFEIGSLICGIAPTSMVLIIGRAIAGIGSAGIFAGSLIILAYSVPLAKRPMYTGMIGGMYGISSVAGPLLGGVFTDTLTWRWCFYINLPIGAITIGVILFFFQDPKRDIPAVGWYERLKSLDPLGNLVFTPAIICLLLALQWGGVIYPWSDARVIALLTMFGVLLIVFLVLQWYQGENATVPPRIFLKRTVWTSGYYSFTIGAAFLLSIYYFPMWFQVVKDASPVMSGVMNLPMLAGNVIVSVAAGFAVTHLGYFSPFMIAGTVFMAIGYGLTYTWNIDTGPAMWIGYQLIAGVGVGVGLQQPLIAVQVVLDMVDIPTGTSIVIFMQTLGGAVFVTIGQTAFSNSLLAGISAAVPDIDPNVVIHSGAQALRALVPAADWKLVVGAYNTALGQTFLISTIMSCLSVIGSGLIEWKSVKGANVEVGGLA